MKKSVYIFAIASIIIATLQSCGGEIEVGDEESKDETNLKPLVEMDTLVVGLYEHKIITQGNVTTDQDVILNSEANGVITKVYVKEGQKVSQGQTLASIDASIISANLNELQTKLDYAEYMLGKQQELKNRGVGSEFDLEQAKSQVNSIKASMRSLQTQRGKSIVKAPFSGIVDKIFAKDGQMAGPQTPVLRLVNGSTIDITSDISEKHLAHIRLGTPVDISFPNFRDTVLHQRVTYMGAYIEPTNRTFRIMSTIKNNKILIPNMLAELRITDLKFDNAKIIDSKAILKNQNNEDYVFIAVKIKDKEYKLKQVAVKVISKYEGKAYIESSELKEGDLIVSQGGNNLINGDVVRIK